MIELKNLKVPVGTSAEDLRAMAAKKLRCRPADIAKVRILKRSTDARKKPNLFFVYALALTVKGDEQAILRRAKCPDAGIHVPSPCFSVQKLAKALPHRPIVCGAGPAGLFAALTLAEAGAQPIVLERGMDAESRVAAIQRFHETRQLDPDCNIQFGEGGAGTFSDGKLTTNIHDPRCAHVLELFVEAGAPEEILWLAKPHIGTDLLPGIIANLRRRIERCGGEVWFGAKLTDIALSGGRVTGVTVEQADKTIELDTDRLILAAGHSARDLFALLHRKGAQLEQKPFSIGVRIEHPQSIVNLSQYGAAKVAGLGAADYKLACHLDSSRSVYTFCMCPGGEVVTAASEAGGVVVNGMSRFARDGENANSAMLVNVTPEDFGSSHPLAGIEFQRVYEQAAYALGGRNFTAPAQLLGDFLQGVPSSAMGSVRPSYALGVTPTDLSQCLPEFAVVSMRQAVPIFDRKLHGFAMPDAVMTGVETRSSSPVRIVRGEDLQSNLRGLYPCGEGAGYAGGIMSAAVDGIRVAQEILAQLDG